jgi:hypothetical protein
MKGFLFTPTNASRTKRYEWLISAEDKAKIGRGHRWSATVTNLKDGKAYQVQGASCGIPSCFCDAVVVKRVRKS